MSIYRTDYICGKRAEWRSKQRATEACSDITPQMRHPLIGLLAYLPAARHLVKGSAFSNRVNGCTMTEENPQLPALDWSQCSAVESIAGKVSGAWVLKGTRMPVSVIF